ncbi:response regulator [Geobacter argillaceus]|uniref:CheY-like chemotaxis protein n=1 Tax=Geobacter argillaceus TaxID=345631 RepID=A0A562VLH0_9BACT|nr:response regulator [Geobacter argillaceus]TWJ18803.1 CheY-like chemotaxis protein [Geobacter argillaceus]
MKQHHILLVEDHPDDEFLTLHAFRKHDITNVSVMREVKQAFDLLLGEGDGQGARFPDLIILDLRLPKIDGFEFLETIRSDQRTQQIPVVILSSSRQEKDLERCQQLGVEAFITKPLDPDKILIIKQILKQQLPHS